MKISRFGLWLVLLTLALLSAPIAALDKVRLQLKWKHQFQFAGYYAAKEKGFYRDVGLAVDIIEASESISPMDAVISGHAEFGTGTAELLLKYHDGIPVVVLGNIFQHSPLQIVAKQSSGINQLADLVNQPVMLESHSAELIAYLLSHNIKINQIKMVPHSFDTIDLINDRVAAMSVYVTDEPYVLRQQDIAFKLFSPVKSGIDFYGDNLFTTQSQLELHPQRVRHFYQASLKGWQYALQHPEEIVQLIYQNYSKRHSIDHLRYEAAETAKLISADSIPLGDNDSKRWLHIANIYSRLGMLDEIRSFDEFIYQPQAGVATSSDSKISGLLLTAILIACLWVAMCYQIRRKQIQYLRHFQQSAIVTFTVDRNLAITNCNPAAQSLFGWQHTELMQQSILDKIIAADTRYKFEQMVQHITDDPSSPQQFYAACQNKWGDALTCQWFIRSISSSTNSFNHLLIQAIDVSEQLVEQGRLKQFQTAVNCSSDGVLTLDQRGLICSINPATTTMFGYGSQDLVDKEFQFILSSDDNPPHIWTQITHNEQWHGDLNIRHHQGRLICARVETTEVYLTDGSSAGYIVIIRDISQLKEYDRKLKIMSNYDQLTGLPNRQLFFERFDWAIENARTNSTALAIVVVDIVDFEQYNQQYGYQAADDLLKHLARRFVRNVNHKDTIARIGTDEFAVLLLSEPHKADVLIAQLQHELKEAFIVDGKSVTVAARMAIGCYDKDGATVDELVNACQRNLRNQD